MDYEQYIKVPLAVITDKNLKPSSKVLFSLLIILVQQEGYFFAGNDYLAEKLNNGNMKNENTIREVIGTLSKITGKNISKEKEDRIIETILKDKVPKSIDKMF